MEDDEGRDHQTRLEKPIHYLLLTTPTSYFLNDARQQTDTDQLCMSSLSGTVPSLPHFLKDRLHVSVIHGRRLSSLLCSFSLD